MLFGQVHEVIIDDQGSMKINEVTRTCCKNVNSSNQHDNRPPWNVRMMVGRSMHDLFKVMALGLGASEAELKKKHRELSRLYHPDKHDAP